MRADTLRYGPSAQRRLEVFAIDNGRLGAAPREEYWVVALSRTSAAEVKIAHKTLDTISGAPAAQPSDRNAEALYAAQRWCG